MSTKLADSSGISFTALYTGAVWHRNGLSDSSLVTPQGQWLYTLMSPFEAVSKTIAGGNLRTFLLQRHLIIDHLIEQAIVQRGVHQVLEIACGLSPRGLHLRQRHPHLHMVEADLPDMAARKAAKLASTGYLGPHHQVTPIDILADDGELSLEAVLERVLDDGPVMVVTEGLTNYFSLEVISGFWKRLAQALAKRPGSGYLFDSYLMPEQPVLKGGIHTLSKVLGGMTHSQVSFHFDDDHQACEHLHRLGFTQPRVHNPRTYYGTLPIPRSRNNPLVRVVEAGFANP
ncbi:class I SAM-dependent methyltransferase [Marinobacter zhejiangensis]|uniref:O-Methyltransferase involved in polyketide biosynthesis n=1 Tax=Marinobacter zhejiangensis TaxID=488535 RepID=A0A1I4NP36_9GAMM|nr:class I SAM-dependent methyltransferase [Marinobacter zhejiangensis]SFM17294.1 O-Methyltransferase involved in polyketide biosynthesis [Marinobacter zhejiangensis]